MPPAKARPIAQQDDARSESSATRERVVTLVSNGRKGKATTTVAAVAQNNTSRDAGSGLKELLLVSNENGEVIAPGQSGGISWNTMPSEMLDSYRVANSLSSPAAFSSSYNSLALTHSSIGRQSPTMARRKDRRRIAKDSLATAVRRHFNGAAVNELDVVVELAYKAKTKGKAFRLRSGPLAVKR